MLGVREAIIGRMSRFEREGEAAIEREFASLRMKSVVPAAVRLRSHAWFGREGGAGGRTHRALGPMRREMRDAARPPKGNNKPVSRRPVAGGWFTGQACPLRSTPVRVEGGRPGRPSPDARRGTASPSPAAPGDRGGSLKVKGSARIISIIERVVKSLAGVPS